jgi:hypothetical protein
MTWVLGGLGVASLGTAAVFWISAEGKRSDLESAACAPSCNPADVDAVRDARLVGDVLLGAGVVLVGVAVAIWAFSGGKTTASRASLVF